MNIQQKMAESFQKMGRWEPGVSQPEENGQEKTILRGDTEAQGEGRDSPAEIWNQAKRNARAKAVHWARMNAVSREEQKGEKCGGKQGAELV